MENILFQKIAFVWLRKKPTGKKCFRALGVKTFARQNVFDPDRRKCCRYNRFEEVKMHWADGE